MAAVWSTDLEGAGEGAGNPVRKLLQSFWVRLAWGGYIRRQSELGRLGMYFEGRPSRMETEFE